MRDLRILPLAVGINETDQGVMTYLHGYGRRIFLPIYAFVIEGARRRILVDTGLSEFRVPQGAEEKMGFPILAFEEALSRVGLAAEEIEIIVHTHLHNDHCENDALCPNAEIWVQRAEMEFLRRPHPVDHRYDPDLLAGLQVKEIEGDVLLEEGIELLFSPGHTPGGQSVAVNTARGRAIITGFCCNAENFPPRAPAVAPGVHLDLIQAWETAQRIRKAADILIPIHDPAVGRMRRIPE
mgnify:FL=1